METDVQAQEPRGVGHAEHFGDEQMFDDQVVAEAS